MHQEPLNHFISSFAFFCKAAAPHFHDVERSSLHVCSSYYLARTLTNPKECSHEGYKTLKHVFNAREQTLRPP